MGQQDELWTALERVGAPVVSQQRRLAYFLEAWARLRPARLQVDAPPLPSVAKASGPSLALRLGAGMSSARPGTPPALGLFVEGCEAMAYKARFLPHERLVDGEWRVFEDGPSNQRES